MHDIWLVILSMPFVMHALCYERRQLGILDQSRKTIIFISLPGYEQKSLCHGLL